MPPHISGSRSGGVEGFFRGVGRGLLGLLTKPAGGVMDMVAMAMDGVSRAVELGEQITRARLPRQIDPNTVRGRTRLPRQVDPNTLRERE